MITQREKPRGKIVEPEFFQVNCQEEENPQVWLQDHKDLGTERLIQDQIILVASL